MSALRTLLVIGTRPEGIKLAPLALELRARPQEFEPLVCCTGQHRELLDPVFEHFNLPVDMRLKPLGENPGLAATTARCLEQLDSLLQWCRPDCAVVQGDTSTVLAASLAAFYRRIPVVHVEAGLRTGDLRAPWPEEMNRSVATLIAALHCAPSLRAAENLAAAGVADVDVCITGNTVIDALLWTRERESHRAEYWRRRFPQLEGRTMALVTAHRRENFGTGLRKICLAVAELGRRFPEVAFVFPVHLNPRVQAPVRELLAGRPNVWLLPPASYPEFVWLLDRAALVLTDSGGVQEEAPALGKPVLVLREVTERPEAVEAGLAQLVGVDPERIVAAASSWLDEPAQLERRGAAFLPYGDGRASHRIAEAMLLRFASQGCTSSVNAVLS